MTQDEYLSRIFSLYDIVKILSKKEDRKVLRIRHKELKKDLVLRCYNKPVEAYQRLKGLVNKNIPTVYEAIAFEDGQIVLEELIDGLTAAEVLEQNNYTFRGAKTVLRDVCNALLTLRDLNIVHRDIKPENIMIDKGGNPKLIDFDASRIYNSNSSADTTVLGTIGYAPPEQYGISQSDEKSDIYALGVLLNVMLTGAHPSKTLAKGRAGRIVLKCTQIDPDSRYKTIEELMRNFMLPF